MSIDSSELFAARIKDLCLSAEKTGRPRFSAFLSPEEQRAAENVARKFTPNFAFFGGYPGAMRKVFGTAPAGETLTEANAPLCVLEARFSTRFATPGHRDFLGAVLAHGLKRETIGDIVVEDGRAYLFVLTDVADYLLSRLNSVGRAGVRLIRAESPVTVSGPVFEERRVTAAAPRLDAVVAALLGVSRTRATELVESGSVRLAGVTAEKITVKVRDGDTLSVRGHGKYIVDSVSEQTQKGRTVVKVRKFR